MPVNFQIVPEHRYPHRLIQINDNTVRSEALSSRSGTPMFLFVFSSPKGRDNVVQTIGGGLAAFVDEYGKGSGSIYGQPYMNAYNCAAGGDSVLHCLRVTAPDATYAHAHVLAKYMIDDTGVMKVKFVTEHYDNLTIASQLAESYVETDEPDDEGYTTRRLFSVIDTGRGKSVKRFRISTDTASDKSNDYKNYFFEVMEYDGALMSLSTDLVMFVDEAVVNEINMSVDAVINSDGDRYLDIDVNYDAFEEIFNLYLENNPDTVLTLDTFDLLLGINKYTKKSIANYEIDTIDGIALNSLTGIPLDGGSDGSFAVDNTIEGKAARLEAMNAQYLKAFTGDLDPMIASETRFPTNIIFDANFDLETKKAICALTDKRGDCVCVLDAGTSLPTKESMKSFSDLLAQNANNRLHYLEAGYGRVRDPISKKYITVTATYLYSVAFPASWAENGGKHVPYAGNEKGRLTGFVEGSLTPILDEDVDAELMDELTDLRVNYFKYNQYQQPVRAQQNSRQEKYSDLTEMNNVMVVLDIRRDCKELCATYEYNFAEDADLARFNGEIKIILDKYKDAQVRDITASFGKSEWEAQRGIIHLYVTMGPKDLVKTTIIEIDVV